MVGGWWLGIPRVIVICSVYTYYYILKVFSTLISLPDLAEVESLSDSAESIDDNDELVVASSGGSLIEAKQSHPIPITAESAACRRGGGEEELVLPYSCPCLSLLLFICVIITTYYGG